MRFMGREYVDGTEPRVYIGRRVFRDRNTLQLVESNVWWAEYCVEGRQRQESLKTRRRDEAIRAAFRIGERLRQGLIDEPCKRTTVGEVFDQYLQLLRARGRAPRTLEKYELVQRNVVQWCGGARRAAALTEDDFWDFRRFLVEEIGVGEKTAYDRQIVVKQCFKWAKNKRLIPRNPLAGVPMNKPDPTPQPCFTPQQVKTLLEHAGEHYTPIFAALAYTGMRFGELAALRWSDIKSLGGDKGRILIHDGGSNGTTKNRRSRQVPISHELREVLAVLPRNHELVFTAPPSPQYPEGGRPVNERRALAFLKRLCRKVGFENPAQYKLHTFRHVFSSMCAMSNVAYKYALEWLGHRDSRILDIYYTAYDDVAHEAIKTISYGFEMTSLREAGAA